jgi:hypothetical protein
MLKHNGNLSLSGLLLGSFLAVISMVTSEVAFSQEVTATPNVKGCAPEHHRC